MKASIDLSGFDIEGAISETATTQFKRFAMELYRRVITKSPVDKGHLRGNWQVSKHSPKTDRISRVSRTTGLPDAGIINQIKAKKITSIPVIFIANNLPYADVVERGLYPNPPKKGSKTQNGYSKQAPQGMARISITELMGM